MHVTSRTKIDCLSIWRLLASYEIQNVLPWNRVLLAAVELAAGADSDSIVVGIGILEVENLWCVDMMAERDVEGSEREKEEKRTKTRDI